MSDFISGLRVAAATMILCVVGYTAFILGFAQAVMPRVRTKPCRG